MRSRYWLVSVLVLLAACWYLFNHFYELERSRKIDEITGHQKIHARQAARTFDQLFLKWNGVLSYLSMDKDIIAMNESGKSELERLSRILKNEINGITRTDKAGRVMYTVPYYPNSIGADISQQKHMREILADQKPIVSDVFQAVQGFQAIAVHYPVFRDGQFDGTIAFVLNFGQIAREILDEIRIGNSGHAWMLSSEGVELYCPIPGHAGKSIRETARGSPDLLRLADSMLAGNEGVATFTNLEPGHGGGRGAQFAYYLPVRINNTFWALAVTYPENDIAASIAPFRDRLTALFVSILLGGTLLSYFGVRGWIAVRERDARQLAENTLRESEERFRSLYQNSAVGIYRTTPDGRILLANPTLLSILGYATFQEVAVRNLLVEGFEHAGDRDQFVDRLNQGGEVKGLVSCWIKHDGTRVFIRETARAIRDAAGKTLYFDGIVEDITERVRAEEMLKESESRYRLISTMVSDYVFSTRVETDGSLALDWVAGAFEPMTGYTFEEYVAKGGWRACLHPDDLETDDRDLRKLRANRQIVSELRTITGSGNIVWVRIYARPVWDEVEQRLTGIYGAVQNIAERKVADRKLQENEERYRLLFEENPAPMLIYERVSLTLLAVNDAFQRHYGYTDREVLMMRLTDLYPPEERQTITDAAAGHQGHGHAGELHHRKRDGSTITVVVSSNDLVYEARDACVAVITDVTLRKEAEKKLRTLNIELETRVAERTAKLEASYSDLESFSYSVSHDLRAPLRAISGFAEIVGRRHREHLNPEGRHYIDNIIQASGHMGHLIDDLLIYSRLGRRSVGRAPVSLQDVLNRIGKNFALEVEESGARLELPADAPSVTGDRSLIDQILTNLVQNALIYHRRDVPAHVIVAWQRAGDAITVSVTDNGIGVPQEYHAKIFDIFQRLQSDAEYPGTGIGLSTVRRAVELLGGKVWLESQVGHGSTFSVQLPKG